MHTPTPAIPTTTAPANPRLALGRLLALRRLAVAHQFEAYDAFNALQREQFASDEAHFCALAKADLESRRLDRQVANLDTQIEAIAKQIEEAGT